MKKLITVAFLYGLFFYCAEKLSVRLNMPSLFPTVFSVAAVCMILYSLNKRGLQRVFLLIKPDNIKNAVIIGLPLMILPLFNLYEYRIIGHSRIVLTITEAILEELVFRSVLPSLTKNTIHSKICRYLAISLLFAVMHIDFSMDAYTLLAVTVYCFCVGFSFSALTDKTDSIYPSSIIHILINLSANSDTPKSVQHMALCIAVSVICFLYGLWIIRKSTLMEVRE